MLAEQLDPKIADKLSSEAGGAKEEG